MKILSIKSKRTYIAPEIAMIKLDNEISLSMESEPPYGPGETNAPEYMKQDPFRDQKA
jgi:hypothetical protein